MLYYDYSTWFLDAVKATGRDVTTDKLVKSLQASTFKGLSSYDVQHFRDNQIDPEWTQVDQVVKGNWVPKSQVLDAGKA
jgi:hypothetical protein